jgi:hypothetical protein
MEKELKMSLLEDGGVVLNYLNNEIVLSKNDIKNIVALTKKERTTVKGRPRKYLHIDSKLHRKLINIKTNMKYRSGVKPDWTIEELHTHFDEWHLHGKEWEIDHIHPINKIDSYEGNINCLNNLQKLNKKDHRLKTNTDVISHWSVNPSAQKTATQLASDKAEQISRDKLDFIILNWDFEGMGKITQRNIVSNHNISRKTVQKYWKYYIDRVKYLNECL